MYGMMLLQQNQKKREKKRNYRTFNTKSSPLRVGVSSGTHPGVIGTGPYGLKSSLLHPPPPPPCCCWRCCLPFLAFLSPLLVVLARLRAAALSAPRRLASSEL